MDFWVWPNLILLSSWFWHLSKLKKNCGRYGCGRICLWPILIWPIWSATWRPNLTRFQVKTCGRYEWGRILSVADIDWPIWSDLWPIWYGRVADMVCGRFERLPSDRQTNPPDYDPSRPTVDFPAATGDHRLSPMTVLVACARGLYAYLNIIFHRSINSTGAHCCFAIILT